MGVDAAPRVLVLPSEVRLSGKAEAKWLPAPASSSSPSRKNAVFYGDAHGCAVVWPDGREAASPKLNGVAAAADHGDAEAQGAKTEGEGDESLFDIVSGQDAEEQAVDGAAPEGDATIASNFDEHQGATLQDTFDFRRGVGVS